MLFHVAHVAPAAGYGDALLTLADAKAHLRVLAADTDENNLITALRDVAINMVEQHAHLRMGPMTGLVAKFDDFEPEMRIGIGPASTLAVTAISYVSAGSTVSLSSTDWVVRAGGVLCPAPNTSWPSADGGVTVTFSVGYAASACPALLIHAAKLMLGHLYANREAVSAGTSMAELPLGFDLLCEQYRAPSI